MLAAGAFVESGGEFVVGPSGLCGHVQCQDVHGCPLKWNVVINTLGVIFRNVLTLGRPVCRPLLAGSTVAPGRRFKVTLVLQVSNNQPADVFSFRLGQEHLIEPAAD